MKIKPLVRRCRIADLNGLSIDPHDDPLVLHLLADVASVEVVVLHEASHRVVFTIVLDDEAVELFAVDDARGDGLDLTFGKVVRCHRLRRHLAHHQNHDEGQVVLEVHDELLGSR